MVVTHSSNTQELRICIDFKKLNATTKKDPYPLPFTDEMLNTIVRYETYSFLDGYSGYHQIFIALEDIYKTTFVIDWGVFIWKVMSFGVKMDLQHIIKLLRKHSKNIWTVI
jgi:hypothetical protein